MMKLVSALCCVVLCCTVTVCQSQTEAEVNPDASVSSLLASGLSAFLKQDLPTAHSLLSSAIKADPSNAEAHTTLGITQYLQDDLQAAIDSLTTAVTLDPSSADAHRYLGSALSEHVRMGHVDGDGEAALTMMDTAVSHLSQSVTLQSDPSDEVEFQLGLAMHWRGTFTAVASAAGALTEDQRVQAVLADLATAAKHYRAAVTLSPDRADAWAFLGDSMLNAAQHGRDSDPDTSAVMEELALEALEKAASVDTTTPAYFSSLGLALAGMDKWDRAVAAFTAATDVAPADASTWVNLGNALHSSGNLKDASLAYYIATGEPAADKENAGTPDAEKGTQATTETRVNAYVGLATTLKDLGQLEFALRAATGAHRLDPSHETASTLLVWLNLQLENVGAAVGVLQKAPKEGTWWPYVASIQLHIGKQSVVSGLFDRLLSPPQEGDGDGADDTDLNAAVFASSLLKHSVCSAVDFTLNDKSRCAKALAAASAEVPTGGFDAFHAPTYYLPEDAEPLTAAAGAAPAGTRWLKKASWTANGFGVSFVDPAKEPVVDAADPHASDGWLVQRYIDPPLLLDGHKFDLRVFVTVQSVRPLRLYIHTQGWANVANSPYSANTPTSHITNAAKLEHLPDSERKCRKFSLSHVFSTIATTHGDAAATNVWSGVRNAARKTVLAALMFDKQWQTGSAPFCASKTLGVDLLVDASLGVWMVEVNRNPGFDYEGGTKFCDTPPMDYKAFAGSLANLAAFPATDAPLSTPAGADGCAAGALAAVPADDADRHTTAVWDDVQRELAHVYSAATESNVEVLHPASVAPRYVYPGRLSTTGSAASPSSASSPATATTTATISPSTLSPADVFQQRLFDECLL